MARTRAVCLQGLSALFVFLALEVTVSHCVDIHLSPTDIPGSVIFNASIGDHWKYRWANGRLPWLSLTVEGHVVLQRTADCRNQFVLPSPILTQIVSLLDHHGTRNYTITPLHVYVHGENCVFDSKWREVKNVPHHSTNNTSPSIHHSSSKHHLIVIQMESHFSDSCLADGTSIIFLSSFFPASLSQCVLHSARTISEHFSVSIPNSDLKTVGRVCMRQTYVIIPLHLSMDCKHSPSIKAPVKVVLYPNHRHRHNNWGVLNHGSSSQRVSRLRRAASNTPPSFPQSLYLAHVPEEQRPGYVIDTFTAHDPDSGSAGIITYSLFANRDSRSQDRFSINPSTGQVSSTQVLDREIMDTHYFQIFATDGGSPQRSAHASLQIIVDDLNDHAPVFERLLYTRSVSESSSVGATIITVQARDDDSGANKEIEYKILNPSGINDVFVIDSRAGIITTRGELDRERHSNYTLQIAACDKAQLSERRTATAVVEVQILDENDNRPQFSLSSYTVDVAEDLDVSDYPVILHVTATDADAEENGRVRYHIVGGNDGNTFAINYVTGDLSLQKALNHEQKTTYSLRIRAEDNGVTRRSNTTLVLVRVIDVNDHDPRFHTSLYQESVPENIPARFSIIQILAYDQDSGLNSDLIYSITETDEDLPFIINGNTGYLINTRTLDREVEDRYLFKVEARDQGSPSRSASVNVEITVRDVNDNAPIFNPRVYHEVVSEEASLGSPVLLVTAQDLDEDENARVTYSISSGDERGAFNIINQMGQGLITVAQKLNYKEQSRYILTVTASDPHNLVDTASVFLNISDANTHRPVFQNAPYSVQVNENTEVGTTVLQVSALDQDSGENAKISYVINDNDAFQMVAGTGEILVKKKLDRELVTSYILSVTATDHGRPPQSDSTDVEITLVDINDNAPKFQEPFYSGRIREDAYVSSSVLTISASDDDVGTNGMVRYTFDGGYSGGGDFMIDPTLGIIRVHRVLDRERVEEYELRAYAVDRGSPELSTSVTISITVLDVNDNAPLFRSSELNFSIKENSPVGSDVHTIEAEDPDTGPNAEVEYSIVGGQDADSFALTAERNKPAVITTLIELDYESGKTVYNIIIQARSEHLFADASVHIRVEDVNDNEPQLKDFVIIFNNYANFFPSGHIGYVPAHDPDVDDKLRYKFVSGNQAQLLAMDENSGSIQLNSRLNSDVATNGTLIVSVSDGVNEVRAQCRLFVRLITQDMLYNSITVHLADLEQDSFLSHLYFLFMSAVASIMETTSDNVFVFDVKGHSTLPVLMVSFSVRQRMAESLDIFYEPQMLRERVYLQRMLLTRLSTLEVLPFDDDLCLSEPCLNLENCASTLKFGNASDFVHSDSMLFRPIKPMNTFKCQCPQGVTGSEQRLLCDVEVNLCYSSPCGKNGRCVQREGGYTCVCDPPYTGAQCQYNMETEKYQTCPADVCRPPSRCSPLIRGGFRCELCSGDLANVHTGNDNFCTACEELANHTSTCQLTTRSFHRGTFLVYASLKRSYRFHIKLSFATRERNALLFYNGRYNERHDFIALEIINSKLQFSFSTGNETYTTRAGLRWGVSDGNWHNVTVTYHNRTAMLVVGDDCDAEVAIRYGSQLNNHCASRVTHVLSPLCEDVIVSCHRLLDFTGPFQLGGLPSLPTDFQVQNSHFSGCIRDVYIDHEYLDLNDYVWNNGTQVGCPQKQLFCDSSPCANSGQCEEAWGTYMCECADGWGGKDCTQRIDTVMQLKGAGFLRFPTHRLSNVNLPWFNGLSFRTRQRDTALLMSVNVGAGTIDNPEDNVTMEMINGFVHFKAREETVVLDNIQVNDGEWHYLEARWLHGKQFVVSLDFGQVQKVSSMEDWVVGQPVGRIVVGGEVQRIGSETVVIKGLKGCVKDIRVGNSGESVLASPETHGAATGCHAAPVCAGGALCPDHSVCKDRWQLSECLCDKGYLGPQCNKVCESYNPCQNGAQCRHNASAPLGYTCHCAQGYTGEYCSSKAVEDCPTAWWGSPICGPCSCDTEAGFKEECNKSTGQCQCKAFHYQPEEGVCLPCLCYDIGSEGRECDPYTGKCTCRRSVVGRRCDSCVSRFAEVTVRGCEVVTDSCPRSFKAGIWWERTFYGYTASQACPWGTLGRALRTCNESTGWVDPDLFDCTSVAFSELHGQLKLIDTTRLRINNFVAKNLVDELNKASEFTTTLYGMDINITYQIVKHLLKFENLQSGLNLTHTQNRNFIQNLVNSIGRTLEPKYNMSWSAIARYTGGGVSDLMHALEEYSVTLARNMPVVFTQPFDIVHANLVLGVDSIGQHNATNIPVPKYNNKVRLEGMFDEDTQVSIPTSLLQSPHNDPVPVDLLLATPLAHVGYILYKNLGPLLPTNYDNDVRVLNDIDLAVNTPVFTLSLVKGDDVIKGELPQPLVFDFKQSVSENRTSPQCVYWRYDRSNSGAWSGMWSKEGCYLASHRLEDGHQHVTCQCDHLSSFAVLMDVSSIEHHSMERSMHWVTYVGLSLALVGMFVTFVLFVCVKRFNSNINTIHMNVVFCLSVFVITFLLGIYRTDTVMGCKIISILLHFFSLCVFSWMFVEALHIYRMLSEIRNINLGAMKFYYMIGYVLPGIIVSLVVGLRTENYYNGEFCWIIRFDHLLFWSLAGPVCLAIVITSLVFFLAVNASCHPVKKGNPDTGAVRYSLKVAILFVALASLAWVFGILSVNDHEVTAFHYLFAGLSFVEGVFVLCAYVFFCKEVRNQLKYQWYRWQGRKGLDDTLSPGQRSMLSRSALSYHNEHSFDGPITRAAVGVSTTSTTSQSTGKSSGAIYPPDYFYPQSSSTSTSNNGPTSAGGAEVLRNAGIPPYGYHAALYHHHQGGMDVVDNFARKRKKKETDSDSELSAVEHPDIELASSHSSDDDDDDDCGWGPKFKGIVKPSSTPVVPPYPSHHTPTSPSLLKLEKMHAGRIEGRRSNKWPGEVTPGSDTEKKHHGSYGSSELSNRHSPKPPFEGHLLSPNSPREKVAVLTHNGSITESELSVETTV